MLVLHLAALFRVGDRAGVSINGVPAIVHWRDETTLVINGTDARRILILERGGTDGAGKPILTVTCGEAEAEPETAV